MEEYEILKKYFIDKEKENIQLKEELNMIKSKMGMSQEEEEENSRNITIVAKSSRLPKHNLNISTNNINYQGNKLNLTDLAEEKGSVNVNTSSIENIMTPNNIYQGEDSNQVQGTFRRDINNISSSNNLQNKRSKSELSHDLLLQVHTSPVVGNSFIETPLINKEHSPFITNKSNYLDFGRLYEEKTRNSNSTNNILTFNKGVIKNIENNVRRDKI